MTSLKPFKLFSHYGGPNPWKVILLFEELGLPYESIYPEMEKLHTPVYEKYNPNGRLPTIIDPNNNDFTIWESGAILQYLVSKYDPEHTIHSQEGSNDFFLEQQYLHFQMSGQGPYFGQIVFFLTFHPVRHDDVVERFVKEAVRVIGVLNAILEGKKYLIGERISYADLAFLPWLWVAKRVKEDTGDAIASAIQKNQNVSAWVGRLEAREAVAKVIKARSEAMSKA